MRTVACLSRADIAAVKARFESVAQHVRDEDYAAWAADFTEDAVFMPQNAPRVRRRAAHQEFGDSYPEVRAVTLPDPEVLERCPNPPRKRFEP